MESVFDDKIVVSHHHALAKREAFVEPTEALG